MLSRILPAKLAACYVGGPSHWPPSLLFQILYFLYGSVPAPLYQTTGRNVWFPLPYVVQRDILRNYKQSADTMECLEKNMTHIHVVIEILY